MKNQREVELRSAVKGFYDLQKLRVALGNRLVAQFYTKMGKEQSEPIKDMDADQKKLLSQIVDEAKKITDEIISKNQTFRRVFKGHRGIISNQAEYEFVQSYIDLTNVEKRLLSSISRTVKDNPLWDKFFANVKGCGELMAAVCLSEFDVFKARHRSSFFRYAGLDVQLFAEGGKPVDMNVKDTGTAVYTDIETGEVVVGKIYGEGRSRKSGHLKEYEYTTKDGKTAMKKGITFNPFLKTKLIGVLGSSFLRSQGAYAEIYYDYKNRLQQRADTKEFSDGHRHNMAMRYMVKMFIGDLWVAWRELEGLPVTIPYEERFLGQLPHGFNYEVS